MFSLKSSDIARWAVELGVPTEGKTPRDIASATGDAVEKYIGQLKPTEGTGVDANQYEEWIGDDTDVTPLIRDIGKAKKALRSGQSVRSVATKFKNINQNLAKKISKDVQKAKKTGEMSTPGKKSTVSSTDVPGGGGQNTTIFNQTNNFRGVDDEEKMSKLARRETRKELEKDRRKRSQG